MEDIEPGPVFAGTPLGSCSNCFRRLPRDPSRKSGVIRSVSIIHPGSKQRLMLSLVDALHYIFRDRSLPSDGLEDELIFCINCGPLFKQILKSFCTFVERAKPDSCVYKFLVPRLPVQVKVEVELTEYPDNDSDAPDSIETIDQHLDVDIKDEWTDPVIQEVLDSSPRKRKATVIKKLKIKSKGSSVSLKRTRKRDRKAKSVNRKKPKSGDLEFDDSWDEFETTQEQQPQPEKKKRKKRGPAKPGESFRNRKPMTETEAEAEFYTSEEKSIFLKCGNGTCETTFNSLIDWANHQAGEHHKSVGWGDNPLPTFSDGRARLCKKLPCPECWKPFATSHIRDHIEGIHRHNFPYSCETCGKGFISSQSLKVHGRIHDADNTRPHLCLLCGDSFTQKAALTRHELCHSGALNKPYKCDDCGASFEFSSRLERHRVTHTPSAQRPKPFPCPVCPLQFESKSRLNLHLRNHKRSIERPAKCRICDKDYTRNSGLKDHLMTVHRMTEAEAKASAGMRDGVIPIILPGQEIQRLRKTPVKPGLTCDFCGKSYSRREYLTSHIVSAHGKTEAEAKEITGLETTRKLPPASGYPGPNSEAAGPGPSAKRRKKKIDVQEASTGDSNSSEAAMGVVEDQSGTPQTILHFHDEGIPRTTIVLPTNYPPFLINPGQRDEWTIPHTYPYTFS